MIGKGGDFMSVWGLVVGGAGLVQLFFGWDLAQIAWNLIRLGRVARSISGGTGSIPTEIYLLFVPALAGILGIWAGVEFSRQNTAVNRASTLSSIAGVLSSIICAVLLVVVNDSSDIMSAMIIKAADLDKIMVFSFFAFVVDVVAVVSISKKKNTPGTGGAVSEYAPRYCQNCNSPVGANDISCPTCDARIRYVEYYPDGEEVKYCPHCYRVLPSSTATVCPNCGNAIAVPQGPTPAAMIAAPAAQSDEMFCPHCGKRIKRTMAFCPHCGGKNPVAG